MKQKSIRFLMLPVLAFIPICIWGQGSDVRIIKDAFVSNYNMSNFKAATVVKNIYEMLKLPNVKLFLGRRKTKSMSTLISDVDGRWNFKSRHKDGTKPLKMWHMV